MIIAVVICGTILMLACIATVGILIEEGKLSLGRTPTHIRAEREALAAKHRAMHALWHELETRVMLLPSDADAHELAALKEAIEALIRQSTAVRGEVLGKLDY